MVGAPIHPGTLTAQHSERLSPMAFPNEMNYDQLIDEFTYYAHVLLGREESPVQSPYLSLMEVATAYHSRAREVEMMIYTMEQSGDVMRGGELYRFRTGQLQSFIEMTKKCIDLGSRRLTQEQVITRMREE